MPFVSEIQNKTISVKDTFSQSGDDPWSSAAEATISLSTSGDTVSYTITMATSVDGVNSTSKKSKPYVHLYLSIDGQELINTYYSAANKFPTLHGSTYSSSITTKNKNDEEIPVVIKVCVSQPAYSNTSRFKTATTTLTRTYYTVGGEPTVSISNPGNNTYSITLTAGDPGSDNTRKNSYLYYTTNGKTPSKQEYTGMIQLTGNTETHTKNITVTKDHTVQAIAYSTFNYGPESSSKVKSADILFYADPIITEAPKITHTKSRLTLKEPWVVSFKAEPGNANAPLRSYLTRIFVNDIGWKVINKGVSGILNEAFDFINWPANSQTYTLYPDKLTNRDGIKLKVGDKIQISVAVWANMGPDAGQILTEPVWSEIYEVRNAGIVRIKEGGSWREGQVYVKVNNSWKEAETVYTKTSTGWKESE